MENVEHRGETPGRGVGGRWLIGLLPSGACLLQLLVALVTDPAGPASEVTK